MVLRSLIVVAALLGGLTPGPARGEDGDAQALRLAEQVNELNAAGKYAEAAKLAAASAADDRLPAATRVMLGGLARLNYELSYGSGGAVEELCGQAKVMRMVAPLAVDGGALQRAAAEEAEARLEQAKGPRWWAVCGLAAAPGVSEAGAPGEAWATGEAGAPGGAVSPMQATTRMVGRTVESTRPVASTPERASTAEQRRLRAGVATLVPGLLLFAPMAGVLAYRAHGEQELRVIQGATQGREASVAETERALVLRQRYSGTTVGAAVLGATGAALAVTGLVLLVTRGRASRVAVAPWGGRGVGGVVIEGRF